MANLAYPEATRILNASVLATGYTRATSWLIEFYKLDDPPSVNGTGGTPVGANHTAKTVAANGTNFTVTGRTATNAVVITGDNNSNAAVTFTHYSIKRSDNSSLMFVGALTAPISVASGAPFSIPIGAIDFTVGGAFTDAWGNDVLDHIVTGAAITWPTTDVEGDLVSTAPSASAAGTQVVYTGYAPMSIPVNATYWTVTDNVATLQAGLNLAFPDVGATGTNPRGANLYRDTVAGMRMFFVDWGAPITLNVGNRLFLDSNTSNTASITLD